MDHDGLNTDAWQLHDWYRNGIFKIDVSEIAQTARKKLKATLKREKKVDDLLQEVTKILSPWNQPIPALGEGIAKIFDSCPAPGYAFALQLFVKENEDDKAWEFIKKHGAKLLQLAVLALSKPGDNQMAILYSLHTKDKIEVMVKSKTNTPIAQKPRGELSPIKVFLRQYIRMSEKKSAKEIYNNVVTNQTTPFEYRGDPVAEIKIKEADGEDQKTKDGRKLIEWEMITTDGRGNEIRERDKITVKTFATYCSNIQKELPDL